MNLRRYIEHVALEYHCGLEFDTDFVLWLETSTKTKKHHEKYVRQEHRMALVAMKDTGVSMAKIGDNSPKTPYIVQFYIIKFT